MIMLTNLRDLYVKIIFIALNVLKLLNVFVFYNFIMLYLAYN